MSTQVGSGEFQSLPSQRLLPERRRLQVFRHASLHGGSQECMLTSSTASRGESVWQTERPRRTFDAIHCGHLLGAFIGRHLLK